MCKMIQQQGGRRGTTMLTIAMLLPVLLTIAAFAIHLAYIQVIKTKVQVATDAAVRAAGATYVETGDREQALLAAQQLAQLNPVELTVLPISATDLEFGLSQRKTKNKPYVFAALPEEEQGNSVRLTTQSFSAGSGSAPRGLFNVAGLGGEIRPLHKATHTQSTLDVAVIADRSGSMAFAVDEDGSGTMPAAAPDGWSFGGPVPPNSRWLDVVAAIEAFCNELESTAKDEQIALCSYSNSSSRQVTLTHDYQQLTDGLLGISTNFEGGATNVGDGIREGVAAVGDPQFARPWANNAIVLLSDGIHNTGTDPLVGVALAVDRDIPVFTVSFSNEADQALMRQIADMTGGRHYHAEDGLQLQHAFREIARRLPSILTE